MVDKTRAFRLYLFQRKFFALYFDHSSWFNLTLISLSLALRETFWLQRLVWNTYSGYSMTILKNIFAVSSIYLQIAVMKSTKIERKTMSGNRLNRLFHSYILLYNVKNLHILKFFDLLSYQYLSFCLRFTQPCEIASSLPHSSLIFPCTKENLDTFVLMPTPVRRDMTKGQLRNTKLKLKGSFVCFRNIWLFYC